MNLSTLPVSFFVRLFYRAIRPTLKKAIQESTNTFDDAALDVVDGILGASNGKGKRRRTK